jgi:hypothetical protein
VPSPWLLVSVGGLNGAIYAFLFSSQSVLVSCAAGNGGCAELSSHLIWTDTLTVALIVAVVLPVTTLLLWRLRRVGWLGSPST